MKPPGNVKTAKASAAIPAIIQRSVIVLLPFDTVLPKARSPTGVFPNQRLASTVNDRRYTSHCGNGRRARSPTSPQQTIATASHMGGHLSTTSTRFPTAFIQTAAKPDAHVSGHPRRTLSEHTVPERGRYSPRRFCRGRHTNPTDGTHDTEMRREGVRPAPGTGLAIF